MADTWLALAKELGVPTGFGAAILYGAWRVVQGMREDAKTAAGYLAPHLERLVVATEGNYRRAEAADEKLNNIGTKFEWSHETLAAKVDEAKQEASRAALAAERAATTAEEVYDHLLKEANK